MPRPASLVRHQAIVFDGWVGGGATAVVKEAGVTGTVGLGLTLLYRYEWLELGVGYTAQSGIFSFTSQVLGGLAGVKTDPIPWLRFELLAEGGACIVSDVGSGLLESTVSGGGASLPYLGGRATASLLLGGAHRFLLGWWLNAGEAIGQTSVYSVVHGLGGEEEGSYTVGGGSWSMGLRIGGEIAQW